jgi:exodeoxyribonuclease VII large subunit
MFRGQNRQLAFSLEDGMRILGLGRVSVYEPRGSYQIILEYVEPSGVGALQIAFEKLKNRLAEQGYFDERHKKPIPFLPRKLSIITSASGAVVHDIITVAGRRHPGVHLEVVPVRVQGVGAESEIVSALELVNARGDSDAVILARGGGSLEDLQAFNSEAVALAIFASRIPVISAVGHETDFTIADFIADLRAPTPSAAAELAVPDRAELRRRRQAAEADLRAGLRACLENLKSALSGLRSRLIDPRRRIEELLLRIDDLSGRLQRLAALSLRRERQRLSWGVERLMKSSPALTIRQHQSRLDILSNNITKSKNIFFSAKRATLKQAASTLEALNPLAILQRGYSVTRSLPERRVVLDPDTVALNAELEVLVARGTLLCNVKGKSRHGKEDV